MSQPHQRSNQASSRMNNVVNPSEPLRQPRQEAFARAFSQDLNIDHAATISGYMPQTRARIAVKLLSSEKVRKRIKHLQNEDDGFLTLSMLIKKFHCDLRRAVEKATVFNPFSEQLYMDFGRLSPSERTLLEYSVTGANGRASTGSAMTVRTPPLAAHMAIMSKIVAHPNFTANSKASDGVGDALREIAQRNASAAPIRTEFENDN